MSPIAPKPLSQARDADARNVVVALRRAGQKARQIAEQTQTPLVIVNSDKKSQQPIAKDN